MRVITLTAVLFALVSATPRATVLLPADLGDLSREAHTIARGRVVAVEARWLSGRRGIETLVTLEAESYLKGALGRIVQFRVPGGQLGRYRHVVVGSPTFTEGQHVIVFLRARGPSIPWIVGLNQGVFRIEPGNGAPMVTPPAVLPTSGRAVPVRRGDPTRRPMALATFERQVRLLARGQQ